MARKSFRVRWERCIYYDVLVSRLETALLSATEDRREVFFASWGLVSRFVAELYEVLLHMYSTDGD